MILPCVAVDTVIGARGARDGAVLPGNAIGALIDARIRIVLASCGCIKRTVFGTTGECFMEQVAPGKCNRPKETFNDVPATMDPGSKANVARAYAPGHVRQVV